jgi:hypothetical protein
MFGFKVICWALLFIFKHLNELRFAELLAFVSNFCTFIESSY